MIPDDLAQLFHEELRDLLDSLDRGLLDLRATPEDPALIDQVFRDLHTIKGNGAMFGFAELSGFVHGFETAFERIRSGAAKVTPEVIRLALRARDEIPGLLDGQAGTADARQALLSDLSAALSDGAAVHSATRVAKPPSLGQQDARQTHWQTLRFALDGAAFDLGVRPDLIIAELQTVGAVGFVAETDAIPDLAQLDPSVCHIVWTCDVPPGVGEEAIADVFMFAEATWTLVAKDPAPQAQPMPAAPAIDAADNPPTKTEAPSAPTPSAAPTVRVPAERLDALMDAVGELVIVEARLTELALNSQDAALLATAEQITRLANGLRDATMTLRMVPIRSLVGRFRRLVSELADHLGKPVNFVVQGEETELDKTLIEKLADPIVHLLRNALDHGVETAKDRQIAQKHSVATITLSAAHEGTEVVVRIRDDGKGMDPAKIREKAVAMGLIAPEASLDRSQIFALIFAPGFSTASQVTEVSGRGVGMDVVKRTIEGLRGRIELTSEPGQGTEIALHMPLTLAIIDGLLVDVAGERYALPMGAVQEIVELPADKTNPDTTTDFLDVRGEFVPFLRLRAAFDCAGEAPRTQNVVIVSASGGKVGIVVDRIISTQQVVIKHMSKLHAHVRSISGATILGDGKVALILDTAQLIALGHHQAGSAGHARGAAA